MQKKYIELALIYKLFITDFYIYKDKCGNACIRFKVYDVTFLEKFMGVLSLEACKQMIDKKHFGASIDDIIKFGSKKGLSMVKTYLISLIGVMNILQLMN